MLDHRPGDGKTVKCRRTSADFIQHKKAFGRCVAQNICDFVHLDHKGRLTACQIIGCAHAGENPVDNADICRFCRYKAADLGEQHDQCSLTHIGGFTSHIGACDNRNAMLLVIQIGVIGNEHIVVGHLFNNGVPAVSDIDYALFIQDRADIVISLRNKCKGGKDIQAGNCLCRALDTFDLCGNLLPHAAEFIIFQSRQLVFGIQNHILKFF